MERDTERERVQQAWEAVGAAVAPALDAASAVVIIGADPEAAAAVALGAGRAQGGRRRVAIGDLVGDVAPLQALVTGDDPHGLVDSFLYGVSLNKIARPARGFRNLYILPSGTEPVVAEEIFRNERWRRLGIGFSEVGALLLLVAPANAPGVDALVAQLDGALVVDRATRVPDGVRVLAVADAPAWLAPELEETTAEMPAPAALPDLVGATEPVPPYHETPAVSAPVAAAPIEHPAPEPEPIAPAEPTREEVAVPIAVAADVAPTAPADELSSTASDSVQPAEPVTDRPADAVPVSEAGAAAAIGADEALDESDEPRDARWIRRVVNAPPTQVRLSAQQPEAGAGPERAAPIADETLRPNWTRWLLPIAAVLVVAVGITALLARSNNAGTRTEAGRRAGGGAPARVGPAAPAAAPIDSATLAAGTAAASSAAAGGEVAAAPAAPNAGAATPPGVPAGAHLPTLKVANPDDSSKATAYAVQIVAANTLEGAKAKQRDVAWGLPVAVVSPMALSSDNTRWFRLTVGAFPSRNEAAAYAADLRRRRKLDVDPDNVVAVPYALLLEDKVPRARAAGRVAAFTARGLPAYALLQPDGSARVFAGAFETPEQASLMASALTVVDITPVVVYRTGRAL